MTRSFFFRSANVNSHKNQPLLVDKPMETAATPSKTAEPGGWRRDNKEKAVTKRFAEVAGGTAADCAAVCCCCPCSLMNLFLLAVYKVPAGLCKKAKKRQRCIRKKKAQKQALLGPTNSTGCREELEREVREIVEKEKENYDHDGEIGAVDFEKEMWDQFYGTGFWRSPSQRGT